jgi:hypothetical protein
MRTGQDYLYETVRHYLQAMIGVGYITCQSVTVLRHRSGP